MTSHSNRRWQRFHRTLRGCIVDAAPHECHRCHPERGSDVRVDSGATVLQKVSALRTRARCPAASRDARRQVSEWGNSRATRTGCVRRRRKSVPR
ncbi:hypothetical protein LF41_1528 [Lysobacter dokdonensis DS-58]|uniref:Uncharacterized protein n=1 Tax=Lysobacter dokdonensis DS-58 TaxID=1300345 RepID=A0A0A2WZ00_9GAMM|nr:hypothetical protein LF41_1528 [Lysobacter dokdonensis DS-58]